ncbi:hypothetical protein CB1_000294014 [Camelus ferus]|nr:hypothetical protein CB1_000294014 [Camelus ferus]
MSRSSAGTRRHGPQLESDVTVLEPATKPVAGLFLLRPLSSVAVRLWTVEAEKRGVYAWNHADPDPEVRSPFCSGESGRSRSSSFHPEADLFSQLRTSLEDRRVLLMSPGNLSSGNLADDLRRTRVRLEYSRNILVGTSSAAPPQSQAARQRRSAEPRQGWVLRVHVRSPSAPGRSQNPGPGCCIAQEKQRTSLWTPAGGEHATRPGGTACLLQMAQLGLGLLSITHGSAGFGQQMRLRFRSQLSSGLMPQVPDLFPLMYLLFPNLDLRNANFTQPDCVLCYFPLTSWLSSLANANANANANATGGPPDSRELSLLITEAASLPACCPDRALALEPSVVTGGVRERTRTSAKPTA